MLKCRPIAWLMVPRHDRSKGRDHQLICLGAFRLARSALSELNFEIFVSVCIAGLPACRRAEIAELGGEVDRRE